MNDKNFKRKMAQEALVLLGMLALLLFITRLWPLLLLVILGIFIAVLRLLFLSAKKTEPEAPAMPLALPPPKTETDLQTLAFTIIQRRITQILQDKYPDARWVWESSRAREDIMEGLPVFILLNHAGGYRRGKVILRNLQVLGLDFETAETKKEDEPPIPIELPTSPVPIPAEDEYEPAEDYGLVAFQWVEAHILELNERCNEAIAQGKTEYLIPAEELPVSESWDAICQELIRNDLHGAMCCDDGIIIEFEQ